MPQKAPCAPLPSQPRLFDPDKEPEETEEVRTIIRRTRKLLRRQSEQDAPVPWWHEK